MYFKAKRNLILKDANGRTWYLIKEGKVYGGEYTTFQPEVSLIITCEDGKSRKFNSDDFYSLEEWREIQLDSILD